jgi:hypothetical protein
LAERALGKITHGRKGARQILLAGVGVGHTQGGVGVLGVQAETAEEAQGSSASDAVSVGKSRSGTENTHKCQSQSNTED